MNNYNETLDGINKDIEWLEDNVKSTDIARLSSTISHLSIQCYYFSSCVSDAYALRNDLEDTYKRAKAEYIRNSSEGITKAKELVEVALFDKKKELTDAENTHQRLKAYASSFDTILDAFRQKISVVKELDVKNNRQQV